MNSRGFKKTGPFVIMIYRMCAADLLRFGIMYLIFVMGFSQCKFTSKRVFLNFLQKNLFPAYFVIFQSYETDDEEEEPNPMPTGNKHFV